MARVVEYFASLQDLIGPRGPETAEEEIKSHLQKRGDVSFLLRCWRQHPFAAVSSEEEFHGITFGNLLGNVLSHSQKSSGWNACIFTYYASLISLAQEQQGPEGYDEPWYSQEFWMIPHYHMGADSNTELQFYRSSISDCFVSREFSYWTRCQRTMEKYLLDLDDSGENDSVVKLIVRPPGGDSFHAPIDVSIVGFDKHTEIFVLPALSAFRVTSSHSQFIGVQEKRFRTVIVVEATFSPQLLSEHTTAPQEIWDAIKEDDTCAVEDWLCSHPTANLEQTHFEYGCSLLYSAARCASIGCTRLLIEHCASVTANRSKMRSTALHAAVFYDSLAVAKLLLEFSADLHVENEYGLSPMQEAKGETKRVLADMARTRNSNIGLGENSGARMWANATELRYGSRSDFLTGLRAILGTPTSSHIKDEFLCRPVDTWDDAFGSGYCAAAVYEEAFLQVSRKGLDNHPTAKRAGLTREEVIALNAYTRPAYVLANRFLRAVFQAVVAKDDDILEDLLSPEKTWARFVLTIYNAIAKLLQAEESEPACLYRGVTGKLGIDFFVPDERGMIVLTEFGFMSTSRDPAVACDFAGQGPAVRIELRTRNQDAFGSHMGVDLSLVSAFPAEQEVLFPPCTIFNVISRRRSGNTFTLIVVPTFAEDIE